MNILFIGDIVGKPGRRSVQQLVPDLCEEYAVDFVIANGENAAGGLGATPDKVTELFKAGVHAITMGNHTWRKKELVAGIDDLDRIVRPANFPEGVPGHGFALIPSANGHKVGLVNVLGRVYMEPFDCPFRAAEQAVEALRTETPIVLVDFHAEATSEKIAMGWFLDGRCSAVIGTHTHVQTADERVLPGGTAYITDVGMTGPWDSVIGVEREIIIGKFLTGIPARFEVATENPGLAGVVIDIDDETGLARSIVRVARSCSTE